MGTLDAFLARIAPMNRRTFNAKLSTLNLQRMHSLKVESWKLMVERFRRRCLLDMHWAGERSAA